MDFRPSADWPTLVARGELLRKLRRFFESRGFVEVETPCLSRDVVVDRHIDPLRVTLFDDPREPERGETFWLQTSPEFCLKRLLAADKEATAIFQVAKAFRGGESGRLHNAEFTLVEWYRVGDDYQAGMQLVGELAAEMLGRGEPEKISWREAFAKYVGLGASAADEELANLARAKGFSANDRAAVIDFLWVSFVEPHLGKRRPTIVFDYPADQAALARVRDDVAERFELYVDGIELANGYHELLDATVLRSRNEKQNAARVADGKYAVPNDSRLLAAMDRGLPACSGCALGFDRLAMIALGKKSIAEVMTFPSDRA
jgi:lysyl-tRNA synthetase class 2